MTTTQRSIPPINVREAFRCQEEPVSLPGGQGEAFRCGRIVLKPCHDVEEAGWIAQVYQDVRQSGFRLPQPVQAVDGSWVVEGWQAWTLVDGSHRRDRWDRVIDACRAFHTSLETVAKPAFFDTRDTPFARADRIAWGEEVTTFHPRVMPLVERLQPLLQSADIPRQVVHGDMTENVLFEPGLPPAVIDFSPYWRPAGYAQAIVVVDALDWYGADESILTLVSNVPNIYQLMVRAELFRISILNELSREGINELDAIAGHVGSVAMLARRFGDASPEDGSVDSSAHNRG